MRKSEVNGLVEIAVTAIRPKNVRQSFDEEKLGELAQTIRELGLIEPLVLLPADADGFHELVAGERRWRAAQLAGLERVPCVVRDWSAAQAAQAQLVENVQRQGLLADEEGAGYRALADEHGLTVAAIAKLVGKGERYVFQRLALAKNALPEVREALRARKITANHAILLGRITAAETQRSLLKETIEREMSARELDQYIKRRVLLKISAAPFKASLALGAVPCGECPKNTANAPEWTHQTKAVACCTDRACWERKIDTHINEAIAKYREEGLVQVCGYHWQGKGKKPGHVYADGQYVQVRGKGDQCENVSRAIVVDGWDRGKFQQVCISPKCKKHRARGGGSSEESKQREREIRQRAELEKTVRNTLVTRVVEQVGGVTKKLLEDAVESWWRDIGSDGRRLISKRHPDWDADTLPVGDLDEAALARLLQEITLHRSLHVYSYSSEFKVPEELQEAATAAGVDWQAVKKECATAAKEAKSAKGKKAPKGRTLAEVLTSAGVESDDGQVITLREKERGPVLVELRLLSGAGPRKRLVEKYGGAEPEVGWRVQWKLSAGDVDDSGTLYADESGALFDGTTPALVEAFTRVGELAVGIGKDSKLVRQWTSLRLERLGVTAAAA